MLISGLQTRGIFCSHCQVEAETITAGVVALRDPGLMGQRVALIQTENRDGELYLVKVPEIKYNPDYNVVLERVYE
ncbi:MAG: hypothetical protein KME27_10590 [Lyngbya sp. HA4199-MV5]|jgi:bifunctional N-acetylglucosamine-1-phosphate-uridyltransferase/glucosamine-1-phosphate-acetyltransferase GlmU-like protein|nr:hypothetical protein [Lyngbya sp. HA4199-MV5]